MNNLRNVYHKTIIVILITVFSISPFTAVADNSSFLKVAKSCKQYLVSNNYHYCSGHYEYPMNVEKGKGIDCSGYVGWAIFEYQNGNFECKPSKWYLATAKKLYNGEESDSPEYTKGWMAVKGSENFQPGDILCYSKHVHIYLGLSDDEYRPYSVLNAGSDKALKNLITNISENYFYKAQYAIRLP